MKSFDLNSIGVCEMNAQELQETDGGYILLLVALIAAACMTSCNVENNFIIGGSHNTINSSDSLQNGWSADSTNVNLQLRGPMH